MSSQNMTAVEKRAVISLSTIMSLRMIGLFMVLPVFSLYAEQLTGATPFWMGVAIGIYGLSQALFQIPFGALSDRFGRKPIIFFGLMIFFAGSVIAGMSHSIGLMILGRALQGVGAVGSTILALIADLTREDQRTKAMAAAGMSIGASFSLAMLIGPLLVEWMPVNRLFFLAALFAVIAIILLQRSVPTPQVECWHRDTEPELKSFLSLLIAPELAKLNAGIFFLHAIFTASFVVLPISLQQFAGFSANKQWQLYLPTLIAAFFIILVCIGMSERKQQIKPYFLGAIFTLALSELFLWQANDNILFIIVGLFLFFSGFSILEAFLPSLISRTAPAARKGSALGIYSCAQFLGIFAGGVLGGWLYGQFSFTGVFLFCLLLSLVWLALATMMKPPRFLITQILRLSPSQQNQWDAIAAKLRVIPGMVEVTFVAEDSVAYLKMERETREHPDLIHLKECLQTECSI